MNEKLKNLAEKIRKLANIPEEETFGSVMAILMIISITLTLIRVLQECNKNKLSQDSSLQDKYNLYGSEIKHYALRRGWFTKMRIKRVMRDKMSKEQYSKYSLPLLNALLDSGENLKDDEVVALVENSNV
jgi:hypothetical protein